MLAVSTVILHDTECKIWWERQRKNWAKRESLGRNDRKPITLQEGESLWWWALREFDTLFNVSLESCLAGFKELFLVRVYVGKRIGGLLRARRLFCG